MTLLSHQSIFKIFKKEIGFDTEYKKNYEVQVDKATIMVREKDFESAFKELTLVEKEKTTELNPFENTNRVSIELSNLCNYAFIHKKCPLNLETKHTIISSKNVFHILEVLSKFDFAGRIAFHTYNEPLNDPRLFKFIEYARNKCKLSDIYISTNGYYLNQTIADELMEIGVTSMHVSAYTPAEYERLSSIVVDIPFEVEKIILSGDVQKIYQASKINLKSSCCAPLGEIIITREGFISLCCRDWQRRYVLGDINEIDFEDIIRSGMLQGIYKKLSKGDRFLDICKKCSWRR